MEIKLVINGEIKTFTQSFVSGRMFRRTIEYAEKFRELLEQEPYDRIKDMELAADYVVEVFNNQFTRDQYIDGVASHLVIKEFLRIKELVETGRNEAFGITPDKPDNQDGDPDPNS